MRDRSGQPIPATMLRSGLAQASSLGMSSRSARGARTGVFPEIAEQHHRHDGEQRYRAVSGIHLQKRDEAVHCRNDDRSQAQHGGAGARPVGKERFHPEKQDDALSKPEYDARDGGYDGVVLPYALLQDDEHGSRHQRSCADDDRGGNVGGRVQLAIRKSQHDQEKERYERRDGVVVAADIDGSDRREAVAFDGEQRASEADRSDRDSRHLANRQRKRRRSSFVCHADPLLLTSPWR